MQAKTTGEPRSPLPLCLPTQDTPGPQRSVEPQRGKTEFLKACLGAEFLPHQLKVACDMSKD